MAMWPQQNGRWKPKDAESFARNFLEIAGYQDAGTARVESSTAVTFKNVETPMQEVTFSKQRRVWMNLRDGQIANFWDERPEVKGEFFFKNENEARDRIDEIAKRLGLSQEHQRGFHYFPPGKHPNGYVGIRAQYAVLVQGLPVFGGREIILKLDPVTGRMTYYDAARDFIVEKSNQKVSKEKAAALALSETDKQYGGQAKMSEEPELGYLVLPGQKAPPYRVRLVWEVGLRNTFPYSVVIDAESGEPIGWADTALRIP